MPNTETSREKRSVGESTIECDDDWCDGPESETLPCFRCFDPDREYATVESDRGGEE